MIFIATSALLVWLAIRAGRIHSAQLDHCQLCALIRFIVRDRPTTFAVQ
jgi:hypothetical protein